MTEVDVPEDVCATKHPRKARRCTLPAGHGPVLVGTIEVDHVSILDGDELAWKLTL